MVTANDIVGDARVARVRELKTALSETKVRLAKVEAERDALLAHFELALVALRDFEQMGGGWKRGSEKRNRNGGGMKGEEKQNQNGEGKEGNEEQNQKEGGNKCEAQPEAGGRLRIIDGWNAILRCRNVSKLTTEDISRLKADYLANLGAVRPHKADVCGLHSLSLTPPAGGAGGVGASPAERTWLDSTPSAEGVVAANVPPTPPADSSARAAASFACCSRAANVPPTPPAVGDGRSTAAPVPPMVEVTSVMGVCGRSERERMESAEGAELPTVGHRVPGANNQIPPTTIWIVFDGPEENSYRSGRYRVTYTGGRGPHRADRLILDYVHAVKLLGLDTSRITVETADKALVKRLTALGAQVTAPEQS